MIRLQGIRKTFRSGGRTIVAVDGVDLDVRAGEVFGVLGQSGAGKSTLLRTVNLLTRPDSGQVFVDGVDPTSLDDEGLRAGRQRIGMIHQHFALLRSRTAAGNVALPLELMGVPPAERTARVAEVLSLVGLSSHADAYPAQLSGGQKQRVGIARALAGRPSVLLSDEATSALDPETTNSILDLLSDLNRRLGLTILLITHEMNVVKRICSGVAMMRDGRIVESGRLPELLSQPGSELARELFPLPAVAGISGSTVVDVTFSGDQTHQAWVATLARRFDVDVSILEGTTEVVAGVPVGRLRVALPGSVASNQAPLQFLSETGLLVEVAA